MKKKSVLVVGAGGIGSYLVPLLVSKKDRLPLSKICVIDPDKVEDKNLDYSNFGYKDVGKYKVFALRDRLPPNSIHAEVDKYPPSLNNKYDITVVCTDNAHSRREVWKNAKWWLDLRAEGRTVAVYGKCGENTLKNMEKTVAGRENENGSCQIEEERQNGKIQYGNIIAAAMGLQMLANYLRGEIEQYTYYFKFV